MAQPCPLTLQHALPPLDLGALAHPGHARTALARAQQLERAVSVVQWVVDGLTPHLPALDPALRSALQSYLDALAKVQADELICDERGSVQERPAKDRGERRIASALTGATPDSEAPIVALEQQRAHDLPLPPYMVMEQAAGWGKTRARSDAISAGTTTIVAWVPRSGGSDPNRFSVADFGVDAERTRCTCPAGKVSTRAYRHGDGDGVLVRFLASQCRGCALWTNCRDAEANENGHRSVLISDYHAYLRAADAFNHTPHGRALLASRWHVEPTIAWLVGYQGCRRARRIGQAAAQCQLYQACAVRNLLLWLSRRLRGLAVRPAP